MDVIAVAVENRDGSRPLQGPRQKGSRSSPGTPTPSPTRRDFFVNQATPEGIGQTLMDNAAKDLGGKGEFAIITASLTAAQHDRMAKRSRPAARRNIPDIKWPPSAPATTCSDKAFDETNTILNANPDVKLIMAICSPPSPGRGEAVKQAGPDDVKVIGLGLPNDNKRYVHEGITRAVILWNTICNRGYLAVLSSDAVKKGTLKPGDTSFTAGRLEN